MKLETWQRSGQVDHHRIHGQLAHNLTFLTVNQHLKAS